MSRLKLTTILAKASVVIALGVFLSGCAYDYLQTTDRVAYSAGDAVKANLESQTTNPSADSQYDLTHLGEDGPVIEPSEDE